MPDLRQPFRDPVHRGRGDDEHAEGRQEQQQRDGDEDGQDAVRGAEMMNPIIPPAADTLSMPSEEPPEGYGVPLATCTMPSTPTVRAAHPIIIRPVSVFWSG
nr:hypothetical protein GCM10020093_104010 [Planobispora longispora]